jgi:hypothetical protein
MRRASLIAVLALVLGLFSPSTIQAQQQFSFQLGGFVPRSESARIGEGGFSNDVLVNNLDFLAFNIRDVSGGTVNAEYLVGLSPWLEAGLGIGVFKGSTPSFYRDFVNDNGAEIQQNLTMRIIPFSATIRLLPLGRENPIEPYIGAGVGVFNWRYRESGEWIDFSDFSVYRDSFVGSGTATGPVILGGLRFPAGAWAIGFEVRHQRAEGVLPAGESFSGDRIDLGGWNYLATFNVRF